MEARQQLPSGRVASSPCSTSGTCSGPMAMFRRLHSRTGAVAAPSQPPLPVCHNQNRSTLPLRPRPKDSSHLLVCNSAAGEFAYPSAPPLPPSGQYSAAAVYPSVPDTPPMERLGDPARKALIRATGAVKRYGWISFWVQLTLSVVSGVILLFSVAFTSQSGPRASLYLTLLGIVAGFLSTFWNFGYTRTGIKMQQYLDAPFGLRVPKVKKQQVIDMVTKGAAINLVGLGATLLGVQALVGILVAKTLSNASANPFLTSGAGVYNPVLALDVFLVQAATNTLLGHFLSLVCSLWLLSVVSDGKGLRFQNASVPEPIGAPVESTMRGNAGTYRLAEDDRMLGLAKLQRGITRNEAATQDLERTVKGNAGTYRVRNRLRRPSALLPASSTLSSTAILKPAAPVNARTTASAVSVPAASRPTDVLSPASQRIGAPPRQDMTYSSSTSTSSDDDDDASRRSGGTGGVRTWRTEVAGGGTRGTSSQPQYVPSAPPYLQRGLPVQSALSAGGARFGSAVQPSLAHRRGGNDGDGRLPVAVLSGSSRAAAPPPMFSGGGSVLTLPAAQGGLERQRGNASSDAGISGDAFDAFDAIPGMSVLTGEEPLLLLPTFDSLQYLDGSLPGDYGFDPLGLFDPASSGGLLNQRWLFCAEVIHGRWAMLGAVACLAPEALRGIPWYETGWLPGMAASATTVGGTAVAALLWVPLAALLAVAELRRLQEFDEPGRLAAQSRGPPPPPLRWDNLDQALSCAATGDPVYPGGPLFNFLQLVESPQALADAKEQEIKHGRLAMIAMLGFTVQALLTQDGPLENWAQHWNDPYGQNIVTSLVAPRPERSFATATAAPSLKALVAEAEARTLASRVAAKVIAEATTAAVDKAQASREASAAAAAFGHLLNEGVPVSTEPALDEQQRLAAAI